MPSQDSEDSKQQSCLSDKCIAIIAINLYCLFDTADNINVKIAMEKDVAVMDLALSRLFFNFIASLIMVCCYKKHVFNDVDAHFKSPLIYRSFMLLVGQTMNVFAISLLPLGLLTII